MPEISAKVICLKKEKEEGGMLKAGKERDLQLEGVDQPEGEIHQDEQADCLSARMRILTFPEKTMTVLEKVSNQVLKSWEDTIKSVQLGGC